MAKRRITFDHGPFGSKHNSLFRPGPTMRLNACVGKNGGPAKFDRYASGYFEAGARLVASLKENAVSVDCLIYPLVMLYRHGIETALKHLVRVLPRLCDDDAEVKLTHNLIDNWKIARHYLAALDAGDDGLDEIEDILKDFVELDPRGDVFRYPEDIKGKRLLQDTSLINVEVFGERMELVAKHLEGCCYWADHLEETKAEGLRWEAEIERDHARDIADCYGDGSW